MSKVIEHALEEIALDSLDPQLVEMLLKRLVITVPAIWSDKAKDLTLKVYLRPSPLICAPWSATNNTIQAAKTAIKDKKISGNVKMITEPEAASLYTLYGMKNKGLREGDAIVVCDAGGGTVDLVSYKIQKLYPLELKALTAPSGKHMACYGSCCCTDTHDAGGVCGALALNKRFEDEVEKAVGEMAFKKLKRTTAYRKGLEEFDMAIKPAFRGRNDPNKTISFPRADLADNLVNGIRRDTMILSG